jgi:hypothetical protein
MPKEIAERLGRNADSVRKIIRIYQDLPLLANPLTPKKRSGRPRKTNFVQDERLHSYNLCHPFKTVKELEGEVLGFADISVRTFQHMCQKQLGLLSWCAAKKPLFTAKMVKKRLAFCKKYQS